MKVVNIKLDQVSQVKAFVELTGKYPFEIDLVAGRYTVDAKSLLGIYSLELNQTLQVVIYSDECGELLQELAAFQ